MLKNSSTQRIGFVSVIFLVILILALLKVTHEYPEYTNLVNRRIILSNYMMNEAKIQKVKVENINTENIKEDNTHGEDTKITYIKIETTKEDYGKGDNIKGDIQKETITKNLSAVDKQIFKNCVPKLKGQGYTERRTCSPNMMFRPPNHSNPVTALVSFPGSGNTWMRRIIEEVTGLYTGAIYCDTMLKTNGFYGERLTSNSVIAIKTHLPGTRLVNRRKGKEYDSVVFLVRNPYDAILAEANRDWGHSHTDEAEMDNFRNLVKWSSFVAGMAVQWERTAHTWLQDDKPLLVVRYEDMKSDLLNEMKRLLNFFKLPYTEEKLDCVLNSDLNTFKRNHSKEDENIYEKYYSNENVKQSVNSSIQSVRTLLQKYTIPY